MSVDDQAAVIEQTTPELDDHTSTNGDGATRGQQVVARLSQFSFVFVIIATVLYFRAQSDVFFTVNNLENVLEGNAVVLISALAMTLVVAAGGIDLSIGIAIDFGGWFAIIAMMDFDLAWPVAVLAGLLGGAAVGGVNALLIAGLNISPFLATLGTFFVGRSIQSIFTSGGALVGFRAMPDGFRELTLGDTFGIPNEIVVGALFVVAFYLLLERSVHGKRVHAVGLQPSASRVAGIPVKRYTVAVFVIASTAATISGMMLASSARSFTPNSGFSFLLDAIAAAFIGASMHPRQRPNVLGTLAGVVFLGLVSNGLNLMGLEPNFRNAIEGIVLVAAITVSVGQRRLLEVRSVG